MKVYTNYGPESDPLPHFIVSSEPGRGPVVLTFSPLTIDGLHFSGARGDNTMEHDFDNDGDGITKGIVGGIGAFLGAATTFINNENNIIVDSAWMGLLQVNNIDLENIHFYNNTLIQRPGSLNEGILWIIFTDESSGMEGGELVPGTVFLTNNMYVLHGVTNPYSNWFPLIDPAFETSNNILASYSDPEDPDYIDLGFADIEGTEAQDFDLADPDSPAVDAGADIAGNTLDYFNRPRPAGSAPDIGAFEFGSGQAECIPRFPAITVQPYFDPSRPAMQRRRSVERSPQQ